MTDAEEPSVTLFEYGLEESVDDITTSFTVVVLHGSTIVIVNSTLSDAPVGACVKELAPNPLLAIVTVFYTLTVCVPTPATRTVSTAILPKDNES